MKSSHGGHTAVLNDMEMYYEIHGQGEPLLLLHGFTGSSANWAEMGKEWSKNFQLIIPDLRGHGRSTNSSPAFTFRQAALDVLALLDQLGIKKLKAIGCSAGGNTLLHMATMQPDRINAMILVSATSHYPEQARAIMRQSSSDALNAEQWRALEQVHPRGKAQIRALYEQAKAFASDFTDMNFTPAMLSTISARTMIVQGDRDFLYPLDISVEMYRSIPQCNLWIVPNASHGPIFGSHTNYFVKMARSFLQTE